MATRPDDVTRMLHRANSIGGALPGAPDNGPCYFTVNGTDSSVVSHEIFSVAALPVPGSMAIVS